ncbi:hypothetical protein MPC4_110015 [Methylocella tundrae]|uniref:Uncharacterized protein n=2 Tax=Methylocella tundrae TaxID=227605 RepID=A0A8B6M1T9_METTU|nr:hypothetical protein MPC4_110015 [Methylocella tundrae]
MLPRSGMKAWEPWSPSRAQSALLGRIEQLLGRASMDENLAGLATAFARLPEKTRLRCRRQPRGDSRTDTYVRVEADDGSQWLEGVIVDGQCDENGEFDLDDFFTVFTTIDKADGELIRCNGANCHVAIL